MNPIPKLLASVQGNTPLQECLAWLSPSFQLYSELDMGLQGLQARQKIQKASSIMLVPTSNCFTGLELVDCERNRAKSILDTTDKISRKHFGHNVN